MKYAKMYAALAGSIATALLGVYTADSTLGQVLTVVSVVATAFGTWAVQNAPADADERGEIHAGVSGLIALLLAVFLLLGILWFLGVHIRVG